LTYKRAPFDSVTVALAAFLFHIPHLGDDNFGTACKVYDTPYCDTSSETAIGAEVAAQRGARQPKAISRQKRPIRAAAYETWRHWSEEGEKSLLTGGVMRRYTGNNTQEWGLDAIFDIECRRCGAPVEFFRDEVTRHCQQCGKTVTNMQPDLGCGSLRSAKSSRRFCPKLRWFR
jgi:hypothetical protein